MTAYLSYRRETLHTIIRYLQAKMKKAEFHINNQKNNILTNQYGLYSYKYHKQTGGPGFHSQFKIKVQPNYSGKENTVILQFAESLNRFEEFITSEFIYEGFKNGTEKFVMNLQEADFGISDPIIIEILDYILHPIDSGRIYNQICIEQFLKHIYQLEQLSPKTELKVEYKEYDKVYIDTIDAKGIKINNHLFLWGTKKDELLSKVTVSFSINDKNSPIKHFQGNISLSFSNTIINKAYHFDLGFNENEELIEFSTNIGFVAITKHMNFSYYDSIDELILNAKNSKLQFVNDSKGNYSNKELGIVLSESQYENNKFGSGKLEYLYLTKPKPADNK